MKRLLIFLACLFIASSIPVYAQEESDTVTMEEVVVTAGRVKEKKKEITSNITIIDKEEIKNSSAKDLGELLTEKALGHSQRYPGTLNAIGIHGFRTETHGNDLEGYVLILVNGRRAGTGNSAKISTKNIERVEIIRGPASVQYGSAAMGGVVNVITRQGTGKPSVFVEGMLGSFDYKEGSAGFSGKYKAFDFSGSFTSDSMNDYDTANGERYYNTGYNRKENCSLNLGYEFLPKNRIGVIYSYYDADHVGDSGYLSQNDRDDYKDSSNKSIDFTYDGAAQDSLFSWKFRYFDGKDEDKWVDLTGSDPNIFWDDGIPDEQKTDQKGAQAQVSYNQEYFLVTAGFDWVNYEIETTWDPKKSEYDNPASFLMAKARLFDKKLIITGGVRYDDYEVDMKSDGKKESDDHFSPRVGMAYLITDWLKLRANYGEAFKMPSAKQLAADFTSGGAHYVGNPSLKPEKSQTYEGGVDFSLASFDSSLTYFHTDFKDKIEDDGGWPDTTWKNVGKAEIEGIEGNLSYDMGSLFSWDYQVKPYVSFTYLTKYKDKEANKDLKYTSDLHVSYGITVSDLDGFSANLNLAYTGKQRIDDWKNAGPPTWVAPIIVKGSFTIANFTIAKKILSTEKYGGITLRGEIQNLFDKDYSYVEDYPMPGRIFFLGLRYDF